MSDAGDTTEVVELTTEATHPLRLSVLRRDTPSKQVTFAEDDLPGTRHLGVRVDGEIVATSTWAPRALGDEAAIQLRGMATSWEFQGRGLGAALLDAGCTLAVEQGVAVVWANARDAALGFYRRHGFDVVGDGFVDETTQLPHHVVVRRLV